MGQRSLNYVSKKAPTGSLKQAPTGSSKLDCTHSASTEDSLRAQVIVLFVTRNLPSKKRNWEFYKAPIEVESLRELLSKDLIATWRCLNHPQ
jgi:hypothetical protein